MKTIEKWFEEYGESHKNPVNKLIHWICVPLIFFSIYGLLLSIPSNLMQSIMPDSIAPHVNFGNLGLLFVLFFYIRLSFRLFIGMLVFSAICMYMAMVIQFNYDTSFWIICLVIFVAAWIGQFIGHFIEGKKPSFIDDLQFLLIGPAWVISFLYNRMGIKL